MSFSSPRLAAVSTGTAFALLALVVLLWGMNWPAMKVGLRDIGPMTFAALRMVLGAVCLFALAAARGRLRPPPRADLPIVVSVGLLQMGAYMMLVHLGLQHVPAGRSAILAYTTPLWVVPGAVLLLGERLGAAQLGGLMLGISGVLVLFNPAAIDWSDGEVVLGNALLMLGAFVWALQILQIRGHRWHASPIDLAPWQFAVAAAALVPVAIVFEHDRTIRWTGGLIAIVVYNGPVATAFCFWAVVAANQALPAITTSLAMLGVPAAGLLFSSLWLGEPLTAVNLGGLMLIGSGLAVVSLAQWRARHRAPAGD